MVKFESYRPRPKRRIDVGLHRAGTPPRFALNETSGDLQEPGGEVKAYHVHFDHSHSPSTARLEADGQGEVVWYCECWQGTVLPDRRLLSELNSAQWQKTAAESRIKDENGCDSGWV